jgi:chromosome segregation ATPase
MRDLAAALAERSVNINVSDSDDVSSLSSSEYSGRRRKRRHRDKSSNLNVAINDAEKHAHYLKLELSNAKVDIEDLKEELASLKASLAPYSSINNEMTYLRSATERSNKDIGTLTFAQLEKRYILFKEEYREHLALCNAALSKVSLTEVKNSLTRVLTVEKRRAASAEKNLEWAIWIRQTTFNAAVATVMSLLTMAFCLAFYWYFLRDLRIRFWF